MDFTTLLVEYLKEQYTQARQHETRQTTSTAFLTAASGVLLGLSLKDGAIKPDGWWIGALIILVGLANWWINEAHQIGNRFHTKLAGNYGDSAFNPAAASGPAGPARERGGCAVRSPPGSRETRAAGRRSRPAASHRPSRRRPAPPERPRSRDSARAPGPAR